MQPAAPFFREAGSGPGVVCIHSNASSSGQWRALMDLLAPRFHILAADTYGAGKSPPWPRERKVSLRDEVELLDPVFARAGERFSLVGHSYGGGIALIAAIERLLKAGADPMSRDNSGWRPLELATSYGHRDAVKTLLAGGAQVTAVKNACGSASAADIAKRMQNQELIELLRPYVREGI